MHNMPKEERMKKETALAAEIESLLPDFVNSCRDQAAVVIIHQDAFAADYQDHENALLGKAIKFAGLHTERYLSAASFGGRSRLCGNSLGSRSYRCVTHNSTRRFRSASEMCRGVILHQNSPNRFASFRRWTQR